MALAHPVAENSVSIFHKTENILSHCMYLCAAYLQYHVLWISIRCCTAVWHIAPSSQGRTQRGCLLIELPMHEPAWLIWIYWDFLSCQCGDRCCYCTFEGSAGYICYSHKLYGPAVCAIIVSCKHWRARHAIDGAYVKNTQVFLMQMREKHDKEAGIIL